jgi:GAF domain-containing protein
MRLRRYDAVVVVLGGQEPAHLAAAQWRGAVVGLTKLLMTETCPCAGLFVYDSTRAVAPISAIQVNPRVVAAAERRVLVSEQVCAAAQRVRFAEFPPSVLSADPLAGFVDGTYEDWAAWVVERLEPALAGVDRCTDEDTPRRFRARVQDERFRQRAVDSLRLRMGDRNEFLDREVRQAKLMYRADRAALNIVDRDVVWTRATAGPDVQTLHRSLAFCSIGVRSDELLLINDSWADPRLQGNPLTQGPTGVRFYAGYPVRTWDGYRVGMMCIAGHEPRSFRPRELDGLRDVAERIEQSLWRLALEPRCT